MVVLEDMTILPLRSTFLDSSSCQSSLYCELDILVVVPFQEMDDKILSRTYTSYYIKRPLKLVYNILFYILEVFNLFHEFKVI